MTCPYFSAARLALRFARDSKREGNYKEAERHRERAAWYMSRREIVRQQIEFFERERAREAA